MASPLIILQVLSNKRQQEKDKENQQKKKTSEIKYNADPPDGIYNAKDRENKLHADGNFCTFQGCHGCPGFAPETARPHICRQCGHARDYHLNVSNQEVARRPSRRSRQATDTCDQGEPQSTNSSSEQMFQIECPERRATEPEERRRRQTWQEEKSPLARPCMPKKFSL